MESAPLHRQLPIPRPLLLTGNLSANWKVFLRDWKNYEIASRLSKEESEIRVATLLSCIGSEAMDIFDGFNLSPEQSNNIDDILDAFQNYCVGETNESYERFIFNSRHQTDGETIDRYVAELRKLAKTCNFSTLEESLIRDKIIIGVRCDVTRRRLLQESKLTLTKCIDIARSIESSKKQTETIHSDKIEQTIRKVTVASREPTTSKYGSIRRNQRNTPELKDCYFCGSRHVLRKELCPAWGKKCSKCSRANHFAKMCRSKVHAVQSAATTVSEAESDENSYEDAWLACVSNGKKRSTALLNVNDQEVRFQIDTAADVNTICQRYVRRDQVRPITQRLVMWNGTTMIPRGEAILSVFNQKTKATTNVKFTVVRNEFTCLLGLDTVRSLGFVTINEDKFIFKIEPTDASHLGDLGEVKLRTDPTKKPRQLPCRRVPFAVQDKVKAELQKLMQRGILAPVSEPTEWVSQMAIAEKSNGSLRICIDPQPLNEALLREHFKLPTLDDVLPELKDARLFSKFDVKEAFWHVRLDEESSRLTTMITPYGRFRWLRLPFGLKVSSEIFQKKLTEALQGLKNTICIADDIIVAGCGNTKAEAEEHLQTRTRELLQRCCETRIKINETKSDIRKDKIIFMGHLITSEGISPDPSKVEAIQQLPKPTDISSVRRLCGTIQYLARYIPNLAQHMEPLRALTRKEMPWEWTKECTDAFQKVKTLVMEDAKLAYFDNSKDVVLQVDSSQDGVGAVLIQNGRPIEYASKTLTQTQRRWAQIEKELLSMVCGLERFDQYTYGRMVHIQNDHKPLASILKKPLSQAPRRLQNLLMRLHRYDYQFHYVEGKSLLLADTLSRAVGNKEHHEIPTMQINEITRKNIPDSMMNKIRTLTQEDDILKKLQEYTCDGWPKNKIQIDPKLMTYWQIRETISVEDGILYKSERAIIPMSLRKEIKARLHAAHLGYDSMMRRARDTVFWPGIGQEIRQIADLCDTCQRNKPDNRRENLVQHDEGNSPWEKIGVDLCELKGQQYIIAVDYYTGFIEIDFLRTTTTEQVIKRLKNMFARWGIPKVIMSDCGPQFVSSEFQQFIERWGITHTTSSPYYHQSNGRAESAVKVMKNMLAKCKEQGQDPFEALIEQRNTPRQDVNLSPAELMLGRRPRSFLPVRQRSLPHQDEVQDRRQRRRDAIKRSYDKRAKEMPSLTGNAAVYYRDPQNRWKPGFVTKRNNERSYTVEGQNGGVYTRNRKHIRPRKTNNCNDHMEMADLPSHLQNTNEGTTQTFGENNVDNHGNSTNATRPRRNIRMPIRMRDYTTHF